MRTHRCGDLRQDQVGSQVCLQGWVWRRRDMGGLIFVDLRDRYGAVQCVFNPEHAVSAHAAAEQWRPEFVVQIEGTVVKRAPETVNPQLPTGAIEIKVSEAETLAAAETPPFVIEEDARVSQETRLKHRYLDLRRPPLQRNLELRHRLALATRNLLDEHRFLEVETPILTRSTPEGARDYLVPSRVHEGKFYALPQSPQLFKQLLMIGGFDRYFQIVRCFRDEDLRADRQPEFTQIDIEMSFVRSNDVQSLVELLMSKLLEVSQHAVDVEFSRMTFREAMDRFGTDRPDLRYGYELVDVTEIFAGSDFQAFSTVQSSGGTVKALRVPGWAGHGRSRFDKLVGLAREHGAKGLVWLQHKGGEVVSPIGKYLGDDGLERLCRSADVVEGDALVLIGDEWEVAASALGALRTHLAASEGWIEAGLRFTWITEFPLLEVSEQTGRLVARHHPFTAPHPDDVDRLETAPEEVRALSYDLVLNGVELGGGSIRIHQAELQERVFAAIGIEPQQARARFGFLLEALKYGAPPHGGIALGFDRIVMLLAGESSLRGTIAFPKTASAVDLLMDAPAEVDPEQLAALHIAEALQRSSEADS